MQYFRSKKGQYNLQKGERNVKAKDHIDSSGHRGSMSKNENFSGNDFKEIASFNGFFYRLDITL